MDLRNQLDAVRTREDLAAFVLALRHDLLTSEVAWENPTLERYLEAFAGWCADMPGWFKNQGEPEPVQPNWNLVAKMVYAAAIYE